MNGKHAKRNMRYPRGSVGFGDSLGRRGRIERRGRRADDGGRATNCAKQSQSSLFLGRKRRFGAEHTQFGQLGPDALSKLRSHLAGDGNRPGSVSSCVQNKANLARFWPENEGAAKKQSQSKPNCPPPTAFAHEARMERPIRKGSAGRHRTEKGRAGERGFEPRRTDPESARESTSRLQERDFGLNAWEGACRACVTRRLDRQEQRPPRSNRPRPRSWNAHPHRDEVRVRSTLSLQRRLSMGHGSPTIDAQRKTGVLRTAFLQGRRL